MKTLSLEAGPQADRTRHRPRALQVGETIRSLDRSDRALRRLRLRLLRAEWAGPRRDA
jgi:hypothetical protein